MKIPDCLASHLSRPSSPTVESVLAQRFDLTAFALYCIHTARFEHNTGIERCVRAIAPALIEAGEFRTPFVWDAAGGIFLPTGREAPEHLALALGCCWWS